MPVFLLGFVPSWESGNLRVVLGRMADEAAVGIVAAGRDDGRVVPAQDVGIVAGMGLVAGDAGNVSITDPPLGGTAGSDCRTGRVGNIIPGHGGIDIVDCISRIFGFVGDGNINRVLKPGRGVYVAPGVGT